MIHVREDDRVGVKGPLCFCPKCLIPCNTGIIPASTASLRGGWCSILLQGPVVEGDTSPITPVKLKKDNDRVFVRVPTTLSACVIKEEQKGMP